MRPILNLKLRIPDPRAWILDPRTQILELRALIYNQIVDLQSIVNSSIKDLSTDLSEEANISVYYEELGFEKAEVFHLRQDTIYHPASLIKLFHAYLAKVKLLSQLKKVLNRTENSDDFGEKTIADDIYDAIHQSLAFSDNDALSLLMDFNSDTCSGLRLEQREFIQFKDKRKKITELFKLKGFSENLKLHSKCFSFAPYGRDEQLVFSKNGLGYNSCQIEDIAKIMRDIYKDFPDLLKSMTRVIGNENDEQAQFIAKGLIRHSEPQNDVTQIFSKAGWTSKVRHDAAFIKMDAKELLLVIMTKGLSDYPELIPVIAKNIVTGF